MTVPETKKEKEQKMKKNSKQQKDNERFREAICRGLQGYDMILGLQAFGRLISPKTMELIVCEFKRTHKLFSAGKISHKKYVISAFKVLRKNINLIINDLERAKE